MKTNKQKILVLSDLKKSTSTTLKSGISLAKMVDGEINFFCVKKPLDIVDKESQLSAMRIINEKHLSTSKEIKKLVDTAALNYNIKVSSSYTFGNIKNEIKDYIDSYKPDIIVLGKRKSSSFSFSKNNITRFILKNYKGQILIADEKKPLEPNKDFSFGILNNPINSSNKEITDILIESSKQPLKAFKIIDTLKTEENKETLADKKTIEFVFEKGDNAIKNVDNYLAKSNVNLLCLKREKNKKNSSSPSLKEMINKLNCSLILTN
jgi:nucleotide-binding universal stress UspA family protein